MRKLNVLAVSVMAALMAAPAMADDDGPTFDFHGCMRSGIGHYSHGGSVVGYDKTNVGRLGNEGDSYLETEFGSRLFKKGDTEFYLDTMLGYAANDNNDYEGTGFFNLGSGSSSSSMNVGLRQLNLQAKGIIPGQKDAVIWAGKRYYQRHDIHLWDMYYMDISGAGAGIENLKIGPGQLSIAWTRKSNNGLNYEIDGNLKEEGRPTYIGWDKDTGKLTKSYGEWLNVNFYDIRYAGSYWDGGWLEFIATFENPESPDGYSFRNGDKYVNTYADGSTIKDSTGKDSTGTNYDPRNGFQLTTNIVFSGSWGWNKTALQFGTHSWATGNAYVNPSRDLRDAKIYRFINQGEITPFDDKNFHFSHAVRYTYFDYGDSETEVDNEKEFAVIVRPSYKVNSYGRVEADVGLYWDKKDGQGDLQEQKYTLAYAISPTDTNWAQLQIMFYGTYLHVSNNNERLKTMFNDQNSYDSAFQFGVQAEAWW